MNRINKLKSLLEKKQSLLILGPRGAGKTWYIKTLLKDSPNTLTLDLLENDVYLKYLKQPSLLRKEIEYILDKTTGLLVFIDEVQKLPVLLDEVHRTIEDFKGHCQFVLTGSSARKLRKAHANLLAGRALYIHFVPFHFREIDFVKHLDKILQYGTLPSAFLEEDEEVVIHYLKTYTDTYLKEEIREEALSRNVADFSKFLELAAFENGSPVNYLKMGRQVGVSDNTIRTHYEILEDTLIATRVPAWTYSLKKQLTHSAKYYFFDNGLINALTGELRTELRKSSYRYGKLFENIAINEILRYNQLEGFDYSYYHYRDSKGGEIDLILQKNIKSPPIAIEIKSTDMPLEKEFPTLLSFQRENPEARLYILCNCKHSFEANGVTYLSFPGGIPELFQ